MFLQGTANCTGLESHAMQASVSTLHMHPSGEKAAKPQSYLLVELRKRILLISFSQLASSVLETFDPMLQL